MTGKEALKELFGFAAFEDGCDLDECKKCSVPLQLNCAYQYYKIVEQDLEVLEAFKNSLVVEYVPPVFEVAPNKEIVVGDYIGYAVKYNQYIHDKKIKKKFTQWIIDNIDKEKVWGWLREKVDTSKFYVRVENVGLYLLEINFNLQIYAIKDGYLYRKHKKLGKIKGVKVYDE